MKIKYLLTVVAIVAITQHSFAQYSQDAVLFSTSQPGSTSRIKAIGNAQTAIGGDLSSISGNPAGIGFFTHSEAAFTGEYNSSSIKASYFGNTSNASTSNPNLNGASAVFYSRLNSSRGSDKTQGWLSLNFGVSFNRTNDFYQNVNYGGNNAASSIANYYANLANQFGIDNGHTLQDWAYDHALIDQYYIDPADHAKGSTYKSNVKPNVVQNNGSQRAGGQNEFSLSMGANYSNQLYLGVGIGITNLRYELTNTFAETGTASVLDPASLPAVVTTNVNYASAYSQNQSTTGDGFNARIGFIYKPTDAFRIGATFTTPTYYTVQDDYSESLVTQYKSGTVPNPAPSGPQDYPFTYNFHTPLKVSGGMAVFFDKYGFISGDLEYVDYSSIKVNDTNGYDATNDNHELKTQYRSTANARIGGELRLDQLFFRGGYSVQGSPQKTYGGDTKTASAGLGVRLEKFYVDATYTNVTNTQSVFPYLLTTSSPQADLNKTINNVYLTVGFKF
jgi:hypothetical protein